MKNLPEKKTGLTLTGLTLAAYAALVIYSFNHLPPMDFRPFKVGTHIPSAMEVPDGAPQDEYENTFYYRNKTTGTIEKFSEEHYPWQDTVNWEFHDMESTLVNKGYEPPIHDFTIETPEGDNILDFFLLDTNYVFMLIAYDLEKTDVQSQEENNKLAHWALDQGMQFIGLTSSLPHETITFAEKYDVPYEFFNTDEITLKTIIRSNPGLMVIKDGTIVAKYHFNDIPSPEQFKNEFVNK